MNADQATAVAFRKDTYEQTSPGLQTQPQYQWKDLARVTFGWHAGDPATYYRSFVDRVRA